MNQEQEEIYQRMRGEYLSIMASLEYTMTFLLADYLEVNNYQNEFHKWFIEAPIPFKSKVTLFKKMLKGDPQIEQFGDIWKQLRDLQEFRNVLAHSFRQLDSTLTARGRTITAKHVSFETLREKLGKLRFLENLIGGMLYSELQGPLPPISADDFADWPL